MTRLFSRARNRINHALPCNPFTCPSIYLSLAANEAEGFNCQSSTIPSRIILRHDSVSRSHGICTINENQFCAQRRPTLPRHKMIAAVMPDKIPIPFLAYPLLSLSRSSPPSGTNLRLIKEAAGNFEFYSEEMRGEAVSANIRLSREHRRSPSSRSALKGKNGTIITISNEREILRRAGIAIFKRVRSKAAPQVRKRARRDASHFYEVELSPRVESNKDQGPVVAASSC